MTSATDCVVAVTPWRYPFLDRDAMFKRAMVHRLFALSVMTSDGLKEESREVVRIASKELDGSWISDALTIALHKLDLKRRNFG